LAENASGYSGRHRRCESGGSGRRDRLLHGRQRRFPRRYASHRVVYYGGQIVKFADEKPKCPVQMHFGETDASIPMSDVEIIKQKRKDCQIFTYPAGHGFYCDERASFNDASAKLAWQRTLDFLAKNLK
jgi:dienelactone hydrolase